MGKDIQGLVARIEKEAKPFSVYTYAESYDMLNEIEGKIECICPVSKLEEVLRFKVEMVSNAEGDQPEQLSFRDWLLTFREQEMGAEVLCNTIYRGIIWVCKPTRLKVTVESGFLVFNHKVVKSNLLKFPTIHD